MAPENRILNVAQIENTKSILKAIEERPAMLAELLEQMNFSGGDAYATLPGHTMSVDFKFKGGTIELQLHDAPAIPRIFQAVHNESLRKALGPAPKFVDAIPKVGRTCATDDPKFAGKDSLEQSVFTVLGRNPRRGDVDAVGALLTSHGDMNLIEFMVLSNEGYDRTSIAIDLLDLDSPTIAKELGESLLFFAQVAKVRVDPAYTPEFYTKVAQAIGAGADLAPLRAYEASQALESRTLLHAFCQMAHDGHPDRWVFGDHSLIENAVEHLTRPSPNSATNDFDIDQVDPETGRTALHYAVEFSSPIVVQRLLAAGADPMAKVVSGLEGGSATEPARTAFSIAKDARRQDIVQVLEAVTAQNAIAGVLKAARTQP